MYGETTIKTPPPLFSSTTRDRTMATEVAALAGVRIAAVAGGWRHTAAVDADGNVYSWGWNKFGQLGLGDTTDRNAPARVTEGIGGRRAALLACGWRHTVVVTADGALWSWGRGTNFQLVRLCTVCVQRCRGGRGVESWAVCCCLRMQRSAWRTAC